MSPSSFNPLGPAHYVSSDPEGTPVLPARRRVAVFFATREGHTQRIAERITSDLLACRFDVDLVPVRRVLPFPLSKYAAAVLAASVHGGSHEREMTKFVKEHRTELEQMTTAFVSVTLSEAGAERPDALPEEHARFARDVDSMLAKFFHETGWLPTVAKPVAGALLYTHYNFFLRLIMKRIAKKAGAETDTSRDYVYTDWTGLDKFVEGLAEEIREPRAKAVAIS